MATKLRTFDQFAHPREQTPLRPPMIPVISDPSRTRTARQWVEALAQYREPNPVRSILELAFTAAPFVALWLAAWAALSISFWLTLGIAIPAAGLLVRLFILQHECGHGTLFRRRFANDWLGRALGVLTLTPYDVWQRSHAVHHATTGNLAQRGIGDITTLTVREYLMLSWWRRALYRAYRHPLVMLGVGPAYLFILQNRLPLGLMRAGLKYWISAMGTNVAIALLVAALMYLVGVGSFLLVHLPIMLLASSMGVWLFYVQHQFELTFWAEPPAWNVHDAALMGSSHYDLPPVLRWFSANIGIHHVHHLSSRIPFYRLPDVLLDHPELKNARRLTLGQSLACIRLRLWDEQSRQLVSFDEMRR